MIKGISIFGLLFFAGIFFITYVALEAERGDSMVGFGVICCFYGVIHCSIIFFISGRKNT